MTPGTERSRRDHHGADPADLGVEVADLLASIARRIRRDATRDLGPSGVTWAQLRALRTLAGEAVRMSELAERLGIARRSATSVVDELVERDLVERRADPADRRGVVVAATPAGARLLRELRARRRSAARRVTGALSPAELTALRDLLRRLDEAGPGSF